MIARFKIYIIFALVIVGLASVGGWVYNKMNNKIISLEKETTVLRQTNNTNIDTIQQLRTQSADLNRINNDIRIENQRLEAQITDLRDKFSRNDIGYLASRKPGLVERIVNNATDDVGDEIKRITNNQGE